MFEIVSCFADVATVIAVVIAAYQLRTDLTRNRRMATLEAYDILQRDAFDILNKWNPKEIKEACKNRQSDAYKDLSVALARIEHFCVGINHNVYDIDIFYEISHGYFDEGGALYRRMMPILESKLSAAKEDYFKNIHKVLAEMKAKS